MVMRELLRRVSNLERTMPVPRASAVQRGVAVNIVLKKDQPTGKLTQGLVADTLTNGDHPRGLKVRLEDGQIGRVQSLLPSSWTSPASTSAATTGVAVVGMKPSEVATASRIPKTRDTVPRVHLQDDYRNDPVPIEKRSLEDYVTFKAPRKNKRGAKRGPAPAEAGQNSDKPVVDEAQGLLEAEFPALDSALIAAILTDCGDVEETRRTLGSLA